jgi:hypothetical protein
VSFSRHNTSTGKKVKFTKRYLCQLTRANKRNTSKRNKACKASVLLRLLMKPVRCTEFNNPDAFEG